MNNEISLYIASDGSAMNIQEVHTTRLINSLAKHHKDIYECNNTDEYVFHCNEVQKIEKELARRNKEFYNKKKGGGIWQ